MMAAQAPAISGDKEDKSSSPVSLLHDGTYPNYVSGENTPLLEAPFSHKVDVALRSKPIQLQVRKTRTGAETYRVIGTPTLGGRQQRVDTQNFELAVSTQHLWEEQRVRGASMSRPKVTYLTLQQIREAEAIIELLKGEGLTPMEVAKIGLTGEYVRH